MANKESDLRPHTQPPSDQVQHNGPEQHPAGGLYADADLSKRHTGKPSRPAIDVEGTYGSEADFLKSAPKDLRDQLGLPATATPDQVYDKMAHDFIKMWPTASKGLQHEALQSLQLGPGKFTVDEVKNAMIARDCRDTGTAYHPKMSASDMSDLERNVNKRTYKMMKDGTMPIDYD